MMSKKYFLFLLLVVLAACSTKEEKSKKYFESGKSYFESEKYSKARVEFLNAIDNNPSNHEAYYFLSKIAEIERDFSSFYENISIASKLAPENIEYKKNLVEIYLLTARYEDAFPIIEEIKTLAPDDLQSIRMHAAALIGLNREEEAKRIVDEQLKIHPREATLFALLASIKKKDGDLTASLENITKAVDYSSEDKRGQYLVFRMGIYQLLSDIKSAEIDLRSIINLNKLNDRYNFMLVSLLTQTNRNSEAESHLKDYLVKKPDNIEAIRLYLNLVFARDQEEGFGFLERKIQKFPRVVPLRFMKIQKLIEFEKTEDAKFLAGQIASDIEATTEEKLRAKGILADLEIKFGDVAEGKKIIEAILSEDESNESAKLLKAKQLLEEDQIEVAITELREVLRSNPESETGLVLLGYALLEGGSDHLADDAFRQALELNPYNMEAAIPVVKTLLENKNTERAEKIVTDVLSRNPNDQRLKLFLAQIQVARNDWGNANQLLKSLSDEGADSVYIEFLQGRILQGEEKDEAAIAKFKEAIAKQPRFLPAIQALGASYLRLKQGESFISFMHEQQKKLPDFLPAYVVSSNAFVTLGDLTSAETELRKGLEVNPKWEQGYLTLGKLFVDANKLENAATLYSEGIGQLEMSVRMRLALALILEKQNKYKLAVNQYEQILERDPQNIIAANNYINVLVDKIDQPENNQKIESLLDVLRDQNHAGFKDTIGWANTYLGKLSEAEQLLREAVEEAPEAGEILYHYGYTLSKMQRFVEAKQVLRRAQKTEVDKILQAKIKRELDALP